MDIFVLIVLGIIAGFICGIAVAAIILGSED